MSPVWAASTSSNDDNAAKRPLYLEIIGPKEGAPALTNDLVEAMAREALAGRQQPAITVNAHADLPAGVRVLRIMVLLSKHVDTTGTVYAAAANTTLFATPTPSERANALYYQGMQQTLATGPAASIAEAALRRQFKSDLLARLGDALDRLAAMSHNDGS